MRDAETMANAAVDIANGNAEDMGKARRDARTAKRIAAIAIAGLVAVAVGVLPLVAR